MIDIKFLRENPEIVKENIRKKFQDEKLPLVDEVIALDLESRKTQTEADELRAKANKIWGTKDPVPAGHGILDDTWQNKIRDFP